jgi:hypothetical protein
MCSNIGGSWMHGVKWMKTDSKVIHSIILFVWHSWIDKEIKSENRRVIANVWGQKYRWLTRVWISLVGHDDAIFNDFIVMVSGITCRVTWLCEV